ncbi:MAG: hypothetical protein ACR2NU_11840 [Aeoliella sp.]
MLHILFRRSKQLPAFVLAALLCASFVGCSESAPTVQVPETTTPLPDEDMWKSMGDGSDAESSRSIEER